MSDLQTISIYPEDEEASTVESSSKRKDKYTDAFLKQLRKKNWERAIRYLQKLLDTSMFLPTVARGGFMIKNASRANRKQIINLVINQINKRNKIKWLKDISYDAYVNMVANALYTEFRCDSVSAYYIIKNNIVRINRGWVNGWTAEETARQMQR